MPAKAIYLNRSELATVLAALRPFRRTRNGVAMQALLDAEICAIKVSWHQHLGQYVFGAHQK